jgi:hypothetical protein
MTFVFEITHKPTQGDQGDEFDVAPQLVLNCMVITIKAENALARPRGDVTAA